MADNSDDISALENFIKSTCVDYINTSHPCRVIAYKNGRVDVQPTASKSYDDGDSNSYAPIYSLRVVWPQFAGGKAGVKGPIMPGDECLMIVCQHPLDDSDDNRKYSIVDSYVIVGAGYSDEVPGNNDMRMYFGDAFISIDASGKMVFNAPGGIEAKSPLATFSNAVTVNGLFTFSAGATGSGGQGSVMQINGGMVVTQEATINGVKVSTHIHKGDSGGNTSVPIKG